MSTMINNILHGKNKKAPAANKNDNKSGHVRLTASITAKTATSKVTPAVETDKNKAAADDDLKMQEAPSHGETVLKQTIQILSESLKRTELARIKAVCQKEKAELRLSAISFGPVDYSPYEHNNNKKKIKDTADTNRKTKTKKSTGKNKTRTKSRRKNDRKKTSRKEKKTSGKAIVGPVDVDALDEMSSSSSDSSSSAASAEYENSNRKVKKRSYRTETSDTSGHENGAVNIIKATADVKTWDADNVQAHKDQGETNNRDIDHSSSSSENSSSDSSDDSEHNASDNDDSSDDDDDEYVPWKPRLLGITSPSRGGTPARKSDGRIPIDIDIIDDLIAAEHQLNHPDLYSSNVNNTEADGSDDKLLDIVDTSLTGTGTQSSIDNNINGDDVINEKMVHAQTEAQSAVVQDAERVGKAQSPASDVQPTIWVSSDEEISDNEAKNATEVGKEVISKAKVMSTLFAAPNQAAFYRVMQERDYAQCAAKSLAKDLEETKGELAQLKEQLQRQNEVVMRQQQQLALMLREQNLPMNTLDASQGTGKLQSIIDNAARVRASRASSAPSMPLGEYMGKVDIKRNEESDNDDDDLSSIGSSSTARRQKQRRKVHKSIKEQRPRYGSGPIKWFLKGGNGTEKDGGENDEVKSVGSSASNKSWSSRDHVHNKSGQVQEQSLLSTRLRTGGHQ